MQKKSTLLTRAAVVCTTAPFCVRTNIIASAIISIFAKPVFANANIPQIDHLSGFRFGPNGVVARASTDKSARLFC
jgi:hypothetical protein